MNHTRIDSGGTLHLHTNGASRALYPGPIAFAKAKFGGGLRMNLQQRIRVLLAQSHAEPISGIKALFENGISILGLFATSDNWFCVYYAPFV
jgi:hypothetical protein